MHANNIGRTDALVTSANTTIYFSQGLLPEEEYAKIDETVNLPLRIQPGLAPSGTTIIPGKDGKPFIPTVIAHPISA